MTNRPDLYWRDVVRRGFSRFRSSTADPERDFLLYVEDLYQHERERTDREPAHPERPSPNLSLYTLAVALLTYGRLDGVEDLLRNLPPERHPALILARSVEALIPLDPNLNPLANPEATIAWINEHRSRLRWSAEEGRFRLDADESLETG